MITIGAAILIALYLAAMVLIIIACAQEGSWFWFVFLIVFNIGLAFVLLGFLMKQ